MTSVHPTVLRWIARGGHMTNASAAPQLGKTAQTPTTRINPTCASTTSSAKLRSTDVPAITRARVAGGCRVLVMMVRTEAVAAANEAANAAVHVIAASNVEPAASAVGNASEENVDAVNISPPIVRSQFNAMMTPTPPANTTGAKRVKRHSLGIRAIAIVAARSDSTTRCISNRHA